MNMFDEQIQLKYYYSNTALNTAIGRFEHILYWIRNEKKAISLKMTQKNLKYVLEITPVSNSAKI